MDLIHNIDEEINRIRTGDTVLICGLYGINFNFINNKVGRVKNIFTKKDGNNNLQIADVTLIDSGITYAVNLDYIYKLTKNKKIVENLTQHIMSIENPLLFYVHKKSIKHVMNFRDELSQCMAIGVDDKGKSHVLLFSGIN